MANERRKLAGKVLVIGDRASRIYWNPGEALPVYDWNIKGKEEGRK
jgi:hypothetical protein